MSHTKYGIQVGNIVSGITNVGLKPVLKYWKSNHEVS